MRASAAFAAPVYASEVARTASAKECEDTAVPERHRETVAIEILPRRVA